MVFGLKLGLSKKAPAEPPRAEPQAQTKTTSGSSGGNKGKSALTVNEFVARTKKCRERGLEPTKPELIAYARYLGIDPIIDADLMWIADESLNAPLPSEWTEHNDSADRVFYYNVQTHASSWTHPLEQLHRDTYKRIVAFRNGDMSKEDQAVQLEKWRQECEEAEQDAHKQLQAWTEHVDEQGKKFYYNRDQERSTWTDPRPARCHSLYLQMKALRVLSKHCGQEALLSAASPKGAADLPGTILSLDRARDAEPRNRDPVAPDKEPKSHRHRHSKEESGADFVDNDMPSPSAAGLVSDLEDSTCEGHSSHKKRKKKRRKEGGSKHRNQSDDENTWDGDVQKPSALVAGRDMCAVEEVCAALGMPHRVGSMPGLGGGMIKSPQAGGDGCLPAITHGKVRAGIKLEPLK